MKLRAIAAGSVALAAASPVAAAENDFELWLNPTLAKDLSSRTYVELETQQRFREAPAPDLYVVRLLIGRKLSGGVSVAAGLHRGWEGAVRETRSIQQIGYPLLPGLTGRTRLEQRFFDRDPRTGWRLRQRVGLAIPLGGGGDGWELAANAEGFLTLRASRPGGTTGLTAVRTFVGFERTFGSVELGLGYTRQQNIRRGAPDRVGHAPTVALKIKL